MSPDNLDLPWLKCELQAIDQPEVALLKVRFHLCPCRADSSPHCSSEPEHHFGEGLAQERSQRLHSTGHRALLQAQFPKPPLFWYSLLFSPCCYASGGNQQSNEGKQGRLAFSLCLNWLSRGSHLQVSSVTLLADSKTPSEYVNTM